MFILVAAGLGALFSWTLFFSFIALIALGILYPLYLYHRKYGTWHYWKDTGWLEYRPSVQCSQCRHIQKLVNAEELAGAYCEACGASLAL